MSFQPRNPDHVEAAQRSLSRLKNLPRCTFNGEIDSIHLMDYLVYEGIGVFPGMADSYVAATSIFADVLIRRLQFREETVVGDDRLFVLVHEHPKLTVMPWPRVYEAMQTFSSQQSPFARVFLDIVRRFFDQWPSPDHDVHPVYDIVRAKSSRYPDQIVELVESLFRRRGPTLIEDLRLEPYWWGNQLTWDIAELSLEALLKEIDGSQRTPGAKRRR
jgi:hypothetical protein